MEAYKDFKGNGWKDSIDVNDFIIILQHIQNRVVELLISAD